MQQEQGQTVCPDPTNPYSKSNFCLCMQKPVNLNTGVKKTKDVHSLQQNFFDHCALKLKFFIRLKK